MRALVLADTHLRPGSSRRLPTRVYDELAQADVVLHAGDVVTADLLHELGGFAPVHAVLGNNDHELLGVLPETVELDLAGLAVAMVHDAGPAKGRPARLHRRFPAAAAVVFGHSHLPMLVDGVDGQLLCNPGSCTWKRTARTHTVAVLDIDDGQLHRRRLIDVDATV